MDKRIGRLVEMFFEDIPYSEEVVKAREDIKNALELEYKKLSDENKNHFAFEEILKKYGKLSDMAVLAGYTADDPERWRSPGNVKGLKNVKKEIYSQRRRIYLISFLWLFAGVYFVETILLQNLYLILFCIPFALTGYFLYKKFRKKEKSLITNRQYDTDAYLFLRAFSDIYVKRMINSIALLSAVIIIFIVLELNFFVFGNSKTLEVWENICANFIVLEVPVYICIKNIFCVRLIWQRVHLPAKERLKKHWCSVAIFSWTYWIVITVFVVILKSMVRYPVNILIAAGVLYAFLVLFYNVKFRRKIVYKNMTINKRRVAVIAAVSVFFAAFTVIRRDTWYTQPYINGTPVVGQHTHEISYDEQTGIYTIISSGDDFKILHLTDIHLGGSLYSYRKDIKALKAVYAEIEYTKPDLVVVTGDLTFPLGIMSLSLNNAAPVNQFAAFMRNTGIPWAFTYGNHDTESLATLSENDLNELYKKLSYKTSGNLLYPYIQPEVTGRNNQLIEVRNNDGTLNQAIFLLDSNAYTGEGINVYDYIHDDQVEWYASQIERLNKEEGHMISSMVFFHIPLQEYRTAYELYLQGSDEVKYFFGENGEKMINKVCCSDYPSSLFNTMVELGSTKAVFCGHDHYNNMSLEYKGIRLTYGMSIDYLAMPGIENDTKQRGAELITLHPDGSWALEQIPLSSIAGKEQ